MTLEKIQVKNFQSIESGEVELGRFTVFTGPSSSGKSAFMRASQAVAKNSFNPTQVRQGAKDTEVTLHIDGHRVWAIRGSKTGYEMDDKSWTKVGRLGPPSEVEAVLKMQPISGLDSTFSTQFDKPYLIDETGSIGASVIGSLTNVSILHDSMKESNRRALESGRTLKTRASDLIDTDKRLEAFVELESQKDLLATCEAIVEKQTTATEEVARLIGLLDSIQQQKQKYLEAKAAMKDLTSAEKAADGLGERSTSLRGLESLVSRLAQLEESKPDWDYTQVPSNGLDDLNTAMVRLTSLNSQIQDLIKKAGLLQVAGKKVKESTTQQRDLQAEYDTLLEGLEECPLCFSPIEGDHLD